MKHKQIKGKALADGEVGGSSRPLRHTNKDTTPSPCEINKKGSISTMVGSNNTLRKAPRARFEGSFSLSYRPPSKFAKKTKKAIKAGGMKFYCIKCHEDITDLGDRGEILGMFCGRCWK
jgi:hypothetical protein